MGVATSAYGAVAFWILHSLPPNGGGSGRLPSLYVLVGGMAAMLLGLVIRDLRLRPADKSPPTSETNAP